MLSERSLWNELMSWRPARRITAGVGRGLRISRRSASADYATGTNELPVQNALADVLGSGGVFVDIGANVGFFSLLAARLVGTAGHVYALEPVPTNVAAIRANARRNRFRNVTALAVAASDRVGTATLVTTRHPGGAVLASAETPPDPTGQIDVTTATLDSLIAGGRVRPPTVVKVDVEGAEPAVLAGMAATFADHHPVVIIEVDGPDAHALADRRRAVCEKFDDAGYDTEDLQSSYAGADWCVAHLVARPRSRDVELASSTGAESAVLSDDAFTDDRPHGTVVGSRGPLGANRVGTDVERLIGIDNDALRIRPLSQPGWGREAIGYGPFPNRAGLAFSAHVLNGHNASQTYYFPETLKVRARRWLGDARRGKFRRSHHYESLAVGLFEDPATADPLRASHAFVMHAATEHNGELWATASGRRIRLVRGVLNVPIVFVVALRSDGGAAYYTSSVSGATGAAAYPMLRPLGITAPTTSNHRWYAAIQQRILGEVGYRVDTRVYRTRVSQLDSWTSWWGTAHLADRLVGDGDVVGSSAEVGGVWQAPDSTGPRRTASGARSPDGRTAGAHLAGMAPVGLLRAVVSASGAGSVELKWRLDAAGSFWAVRVDRDGCAVVRSTATEPEKLVAIDPSRTLRAEPLVLQVLDDGRHVAVHVDGELLGDRWLPVTASEGHGIGFVVAGAAVVGAFEAHPAEIALPDALDTGAPWEPAPSRIVLDEYFDVESDDLAGVTTPSGQRRWERSVGSGEIVLRGEGNARVRASRDEPNPDRTIFTVAWDDPNFADVSIDMTPPGRARGAAENGRVGIVFWQDSDNYLVVNVYVDDDFNGASISTFYHLNGYENMYDAVWTLVQGVEWGKRCTLRAAFDGHRFMSWANDEPALVRALTDVYPATPPLKIERIGIIVNEEWGNDTGTLVHGFRASVRADG